MPRRRVVADAKIERLARRLLAGGSQLVERLAAAYQAGDPNYGAMSEQELRGDVLPASEGVIFAFLTAVSDGRVPTVDREAAEEIGRRRLEMGVPLDAMLHVFRIGGRVVFEAIVEAIEPGEEQSLAPIGLQWMEFIDQASSHAASAYLHASHERVRLVEARRSMVLDVLLSARDRAELQALSAEFSLNLADEYVPLLVNGKAVASQVERLLDESPPGSLIGTRGGGVLVLAPAKAPDVRQVQRLLGECLIVVGQSAEPGPALRTEVDRALRILTIASARGQTGVFDRGSFLLEQFVAGNPELAQQVHSSIITPIREHDRGGLLESTLRTYLATGSVAATADREAAHANTVTYRLRRIEALTGYDARNPQHAAVLVLALAASG